MGQQLPNGNVVTRKSPFEEIEEIENLSQNSQNESEDQTLFMYVVFLYITLIVSIVLTINYFLEHWGTPQNSILWCSVDWNMFLNVFLKYVCFF